MMLRKIVLSVSVTGSLLLLLAIWSALLVQARSQQIATDPDMNTLPLVNQIGGGTYATARQGNYAYMGMGPRLLIMDVQDPVHPAILGQTEVLNGLISEIRLMGDYAYLSIGSGLSIVDISDPNTPSQIGFYDSPNPVRGIAISGTLAYLTEGRIFTGSQYEGGGLLILDISDPTNPTQIGLLNTEKEASNVSLFGDYAYLSQDMNMVIVDVSTPSTPTQVNSLYAGGPTRGSFISDGYLYLTLMDLGLGIYDLANPQNPSNVFVYDTTGHAVDVTINDLRAYVSTSQDMVILDVSIPAFPTLLGSYTSWVANTSIEGDYAYVAKGSKGIGIVNISDPAAPVEVAAYAMFGEPYGIDIENGYAYLLDQWEGLYILDLANPSEPTIVGRYASANAIDFEVAGSFVYLANYSTLDILDVTEPTTPTVAAQHPVPGTARDVSIDGSYAYIAANSAGLQIVNISNPQIPVTVGSLGLPAYVGYVAVANGFAYLANSFGSHVYIIDVDNPQNPTLVSTYTLTGTISGIAASGSYLYLSQNNLGLHIVDITSPVSPTMAGFYAGWYGDGDIEVSGNYAFLASSVLGVAAINISIPAAPSGVGFHNTAGQAKDLAVGDNLVYVADTVGGLLIFRANYPVYLPMLMKP